MKKGFKFGVATSSLQIEGTKGKFKTIWDMSQRNILDQSNCDMACNFVDLYEKDIDLISNLGVDVYRMSISWARIQPEEGKVSASGIQFYKNVFETLKKKGIEVDVTLYHWDMPLWLMNKGIGFHHLDSVPYFLSYASICFEAFDTYVRTWATFNEPWCISRVGYIYGTHAPFMVHEYQLAIQTDYYMLKAHKEVYDYYKSRYQKPIGIVLNVWGNIPLTNDSKDMMATEHSHQFYEGVYLHPLCKGGYAKIWLDILNSLGLDLTFIDQKELQSFKGKTDFLGINYYMHNTVTYDADSPLKFKTVQTNYPKTDMGWEINAEGLRFVLTEIRKRYTDIPIYITENGIALNDVVEDGKIQDNLRTRYIQDHFQVIKEIEETHNIKGYYVWSLLDNFEWHFGYTKRFGLVHVDYSTYQRIPKQSYYEYKKIIEQHKEKRAK